MSRPRTRMGRKKRRNSGSNAATAARPSGSEADAAGAPVAVHALSQDTVATAAEPATITAVRQLPTVSICTVTQNRSHLLPLLETCILNQSYPRPLLEWVIVDDSSPEHPQFKPAPDTGLKTRVVQIDQKLVLGHKRNLSHRFCEGEVIVYMDDDEFYPPSRIEHAVESLQSSGKEVAGASRLPILFIPECELWMAGPYGANHATANTFAMRRSLLGKTQYNNAATHAEEKDFLKGYSFPMVQLDPKQTIICFGHGHNTFDKRRLICDGQNPRMKKLADADSISAWIAPDLLQRYLQAHGLPPKTEQRPPMATSIGKQEAPKATLFLVCSPPGSGERLIFQALGKLGATCVVGQNNEEELLSSQLLQPSSLQQRVTAEIVRQSLQSFGDLVLSTQQQVPAGQPIVLRDPRAAVLLDPLARAVDVRLIVCLHPLLDLARDRGSEEQSFNDYAVQEAHRIYGLVCSQMINGDIPFHLIRSRDLSKKPLEVLNGLSQFCGLHPTSQQLEEATAMASAWRP